MDNPEKLVTYGTNCDVDQTESAVSSCPIVSPHKNKTRKTDTTQNVKNG